MEFVEQRHGGMTNLTYLFAILGLAASAASAAQVEFVGDYSFDIDAGGNSVTVEIEELHNASGAGTTGPLYLSLRYTQCDAPASRGFSSFEVDFEANETARPGFYPLDREVSGGNSRLAAQASWTDIRFTTDYRPPPAGTYRRHLAVYELDASEREEGTLEMIGAATFPYRHVQSGREELDSCFTALPLDVDDGHRRAGLSHIDGGDYFHLQSLSRGALEVDVAGNFEFVAELLDSEGRAVDARTNNGNLGKVRIDRQIDGRNYYLRVRPHLDGYGSYTVRTAFTPGTGGSSRDGDDDTARLATPLGIGEEVCDAIDEAGDVDWWSFKTRSMGRFVLETTGSAEGRGVLYDASVARLPKDHDAHDRQQYRLDDGAIVEPGTYYLRVTGRGYSTSGSYTLRAVHIPEDETGRPDLVADFADTGVLELMPGETHRMVVELHNRGNGTSERRAVRLYQSDNRVISQDDEFHNSESFNAIDPLTFTENVLRFNGVREPGNYYIGVCVHASEDESDTDNNCSSARRVVVGDVPGAATTEPVVRRYSLPLVLSASDSRRQGFVRLINRSEEAGTVLIHATDDAGVPFGPVEIEMDARASFQFDADDLERGNPGRGMANGIGSGLGDWRLELETSLDIAPLAYARTSEGFLTGMRDTAEMLDDGRYFVPIFNPARNTQQVSTLRLVNPGTEDADIRISGLDDRSAPPPEGYVELMLPAGESLNITADELESGSDGLIGRFGPGSGKWRLFLTASAPIDVLSLMDSPTGNLSNLSSRGRSGSVPLVLSTKLRYYRTSFVRIVNWSDTPGSVQIRGIDDAGRQSETITLSLDAGAVANFNSFDLESGNEAKGLSGGIGRRDEGWRLELESDLDIEALSYVRTADGFVTGLHDLTADREGIVDVPLFNPARNTDQESRLRLFNPGEMDARVKITGWDDNGRAASYGNMYVTVPAGKVRTITALQLETGARGLRGRFGDGVGKWRLSIASEQPLEVMSLLESSTGELGNLSMTGSAALEPVSGERLDQAGE